MSLRNSIEFFKILTLNMKQAFIYISSTLIIFFLLSCSSSKPKLIAMNCLLPPHSGLTMNNSINLISFFPWGNVIADEPPQIIGGTDSLITKIKYPEIAEEAGIRGIIITEFIIDISGIATDIKIIKGLNSFCDESVMNAIKIQKYLPAINNGNPANQLMRAAVKFDLSYIDVKIF